MPLFKAFTPAPSVGWYHVLGLQPHRHGRRRQGTRMIRIAFFDIDGTLVSFKTHAMSASTVRALDTMRRNGVRTVISTGRSLVEMPVELQKGFDAYITLNGQRCFCGSDVFRNVHLDPADVRVIVDQVEQGLYDVVVKLDRGDGYSYVNRRSPRVIENETAVNLVNPVDDIRLALGNPVYQFCAYVDPEDEHILLDATENVVTTRWSPLFCDVVPAQGGKDLGVAATLEHFGFTADEAIAFGDGENDLPMLSAVGTGVAMGNAWDIVKERADYVTDDVDSDGIWNACRHFGLV